MKLKSINKGLRSELSILSGIASVALLLSKKPKAAAALSLAGVLVRALPSKTESFENKTVVITGGSRGLGFALAKRFLEDGANVAILARDQKELNKAEKMLNKENEGNGQVHSIVCDVTNVNEFYNALVEVEEIFLKIDVLINNAGAISAGPFDTMNIDDFKAQMNLHAFAVIEATKTVVPFFVRSGKGHIVNISSVGGKMPVPHMTSYSTSKFALAGFSESVGAELAEKNIQVTSVYPGLMRTGSAIQAVFKGNQEKEYSLFTALDLLPGLSVSAEYAADRIMEAVRAGDSQVVIGTSAKLGKLTHSNFPEIYNFMMKLGTKFLPKGKSTVRLTGAQVRSWIDTKWWFKPFENASFFLEKKLNQKEKDDAEFNLNIKRRRKSRSNSLS